MENITISTFGRINLEHSGWKYYNVIKKKAMEQEFSWAGFAISLSIAFFIVIGTAACLSLAYQALDDNVLEARDIKGELYRLEISTPQSIDDFLNISNIPKEKIEVIKISSAIV